MSAVPDRFNSTSAATIGSVVYGQQNPPLTKHGSIDWKAVQILQEKPLREAMRSALAVLGEGGCPDCKCSGCSAEMAEAHRILREALGDA